MATETHRVHTSMQNLHFVRFSQDTKAIKVIFHDLLANTIYIYKKEPKKSSYRKKIYVRSRKFQCVPVFWCDPIFLCTARHTLYFKSFVHMTQWNSNSYICLSYFVIALLSSRYHLERQFFFFFFFFFFACRFILNENSLSWLTLFNEKPFFVSVLVLCFQIFTLKLNLRQNVGLTYAISIVKWFFFLFFY